MTRRNRATLFITSGCVVLIGIWAGAMASSLSSAGMIHVEVHGEDDVSIHIPAVAVSGLINCLPRECFSDVTDECGEYAPLLRAVCDELEGQPDFTLVRVRSDDELVSIRKVGNALVIDVDNGDEDVHVSLPLGVALTVARKFERSHVRLGEGRFSTYRSRPSESSGVVRPLPVLWIDR